MSAVSTVNGSFGCVYVAVVDVPFLNLLTSTCGILDVISSSSIFVMNFLNAKSNSCNINFSKSSSSYCPL